MKKMDDVMDTFFGIPIGLFVIQRTEHRQEFQHWCAEILERGIQRDIHFELCW